MESPRRVLFISGEVAPFAQASDIAQITRLLPEYLQESGPFETRIMMPRYGTISERRNRLHEVIRLSGIQVEMDDPAKPENLKVKVASIPGIRLQVYFMDNVRYFKRKGIFADREGNIFDDNNHRALFFGRAVLETTRKLGWKPDVVHALGSMSALVPLLLSTEFAQDPLFAEAKVVFTPSATDTPALQFSDTDMQTLNLKEKVLAQRPFQEIAPMFAKTLTFAPATNGESNGEAPHFSAEAITNEAIALYDQMLSETELAA